MSETSWTFRPVRAADGSVPGYVVTLHPAERDVLIALVGEVAVLVGGDVDVTAHLLDAPAWSRGPVAAPEDPALRRLFPDAYRDDAEHAAEFRRLTEQDLRATKADRLGVLGAALHGPGADGGPGGDGTDAARLDTDGLDAGTPHDTVDVVVPARDAPAVVAALTDLRLVLAERLGVRTAQDADAVVRLVTRPSRREVADPVRAAHRLRATVYLMLGVLQDTLLEAMTGAGGDEHTTRLAP